MRLEPRGVALDRMLERCLPGRARQRERIGERLEEHAIAPVDLQAEQEIDGAFEEAREHERPLRERRRAAEKRRAQRALLVPHGHAIADDRGPNWPDDSKRPLTEHGVVRFKEVVDGLKEIDVDLGY